ncbi:MAG: DUF4249 family protein [Bacteroidota bacterium]
MNANLLIYKYLVVIALLLMLSWSCEENFDVPIIPGNRPVIVVEGHLEAYSTNPSDLGVQPRPAYVILTKSVPFGQAFDADDFEELFVRDAVVNITTSRNRSIPLSELCLNSLPPSEREFLINATGLNSADFAQIGIDFRKTDFCVYIDLSAGSFEIGDTFQLNIQADDIELTATTTTPIFYPIENIDFRVPPGDTSFFSGTTLRQMLIQTAKPDSLNNQDIYFRYFTQRNDEPLYKGNAPLAGFRSVFGGKVLGSGTESVALLRGEARDSTFNPGGNNFGNFRVNDRYLVKWMNIDEAHYNYWNSTEFNALNQGFFSSYTLPQFNIEGEGGIGIFGAYTVGFYGGRVPKE